VTKQIIIWKFGKFIKRRVVIRVCLIWTKRLKSDTFSCPNLKLFKIFKTVHIRHGTKILIFRKFFFVKSGISRTKFKQKVENELKIIYRWRHILNLFSRSYVALIIGLVSTLKSRSRPSCLAAKELKNIWKAWLSVILTSWCWIDKLNWTKLECFPRNYDNLILQFYMISLTLSFVDRNDNLA